MRVLRLLDRTFRAGRDPRLPRGLISRLLCCTFCCAAIAAFPAPSRAQTPSSPQASAPSLQQRYDDAFIAFYSNPNDLRAVEEYARLAAEIGDFEGAIGALERLVVQAPNAADIQFQLGRLYAHLSSFDAARTWYQKALTGNLSAADRAAAEADLATLATKDKRNKLAVTLLGGLSYETNANAGPTSVSSSFGNIFSSSVGPKSDSKVFTSASLTDRYDLGTQDASTLETRLSLYASRQFRLHALNIMLVEADSGPRFPLGDANSGTSIRPYLIGTALGLGNSLYFAGPGLGTNLATRLLPDLTLSSTLEARGLSFHNFAAEPLATAKDAVELIGRFDLAYALGADDEIDGNLQAIGYAARRDYESFRQLTLGGTYTHRFAAPWTLSDAPWTLAISGNHVWRPYGSANPTVDPFTSRTDREWNTSATLVAGLPGGAFAQAQVSQAWVRSTVAYFAYHDRTVSLAVGVSF